MTKMVTSDDNRHFQDLGYVVLKGLIRLDELSAAQAALWEHYPPPNAYFPKPSRYAWLAASPFAGLIDFPWAKFSLNRLTVHPGIIAAVRWLLGVDDLRLVKAELWAKYGNAVNYDQAPHTDYGNHTLTVPRRDGLYREATLFIFLSDVTDQTSPPAVVPRPISDRLPFGVMEAPHGTFREQEVRITAEAGSILVYAYDLFHRGTAMLDPSGSRFMLLNDYRDAAAPWIGKHAIGANGRDPRMVDFVSRIGPDERMLLGFPPPGHPYWNMQTIADCQLRYADMDVSPYRDARAGAGGDGIGPM